MKKIITAALLSFSMLFTTAGAAYVNCDVLNVRVSPNTECEIVDKLPCGTSVDIIYTDNGWHNIRMKNGITGFVSAQYINLNEKAASSSVNGPSIAKMASQYIGCSYVYGATGPSAFDCSGLTTYVMKNHGYSIPRTASTQANIGAYVEKSELEAGDLVFFSNRNDRRINHVGIYVGNRNFVHASTSVRGVVMDSLDSKYYTKNYITARRIA